MGFIGDDGSVIDINKYRTSFARVQHEIERAKRVEQVHSFHRSFETRRQAVLDNRIECDMRRFDDIRHLKNMLQQRRAVLGSPGGNPLSTSRMREYKERESVIN
jgi:hypothetical protein